MLQLSASHIVSHRAHTQSDHICPSDWDKSTRLLRVRGTILALSSGHPKGGRNQYLSIKLGYCTQICLNTVDKKVRYNSLQQVARGTVFQGRGRSWNITYRLLLILETGAYIIQRRKSENLKRMIHTQIRSIRSWVNCDFDSEYHLKQPSDTFLKTLRVDNYLQ